MAWTLVGETAFDVAGGTGTEDKTLPGTLAEDDIVLVGMSCDQEISGAAEGGGIILATEGYTQLDIHSGSGAPGSQLAYKIMGSTPDSDVTIQQKANSERKQGGVIQVWRGVDTSTPIDVTSTTATGSGAPNSPSITPVTDGCLIMTWGFLDDDESASSVTAPSGYGDLIAGDTNGASANQGATTMVASLTQTTAEAINPGAFGGGLNDAWRAVTVALRPAAGGGATIGRGQVDFPRGMGRGFGRGSVMRESVGGIFIPDRRLLVPVGF